VRVLLEVPGLCVSLGIVVVSGRESEDVVVMLVVYELTNGARLVAVVDCADGSSVAVVVPFSEAAVVGVEPPVAHIWYKAISKSIPSLMKINKTNYVFYSCSCRTKELWTLTAQICLIACQT
jgi:hypothetical protein